MVFAVGVPEVCSYKKRAKSSEIILLSIKEDSMKLQILLVAQLMIASTVLAQDSKIELLGDFREGWKENWVER